VADSQHGEIPLETSWFPQFGGRFNSPSFKVLSVGFVTLLVNNSVSNQHWKLVASSTDWSLGPAQNWNNVTEVTAQAQYNCNAKLLQNTNVM